MTQPPLLIRELERIARDRGWSTAHLAEQLGLSEKSFYNLRIGINTVSMATLSRIDCVFGKERTIHGLIHHYLTREYPALGRERAGLRPADLPASIPYKARWQILAWLRAIPANESPRRSLFLMSADTAALAATARFLAEAARAAHLGVAILRADQRLTVSEAKDAAGVDLLIVERADHAREDVIAVLDRRGNAFRPTLVTSVVDRDLLDDSRLVRILRASTVVLRLAPTRAAISSSTFAHVSA